MNNSDVNNPRRLIRAIEIAKSNFTSTPSNSDIDIKMLGLRYFDNSNHRSAIKSRVIERLGSGAIEETRALLLKYDLSLKSMTAIGYKSIIAYLEGNLSHEKMVENWIADEMAYAKRQLTWFNKLKSIEWYDSYIKED
jgi:tRNA dimethylallyltransferase